jgi:hypothetical protein
MSGLPNIKRGRLTAGEKAAIERLAGTLKKPTPGVIACRLARHPATVAFDTIRHGLIARAVRYGNRPVATRANGTKANPYTAEQDRRLIELRRGGLVFREIAAMLTREFGVPRNCHSVQVRCLMLAAYEGGELA